MNSLSSVCASGWRCARPFRAFFEQLSSTWAFHPNSIPAPSYGDHIAPSSSHLCRFVLSCLFALCSLLPSPSFAVRMICGDFCDFFVIFVICRSPPPIDVRRQIGGSGLRMRMRMRMRMKVFIGDLQRRPVVWASRRFVYLSIRLFFAN